MAGGLTEMLRIGALASAMEVQLAPHVWGSAFLQAASLQLAGALPNYYLFEFGQAYSPLRSELVTEPIEIQKDGLVEIPRGPGLGVEIVPDAERRFPFDPHAAERKALV
jgi:galactonate dehydratase